MTTNLPTRKKIIEVTLNYYEWSNAETAHINPLQLNKSGMCGREFLAGNAGNIQPHCYSTSVQRKTIF